MIDLAKGLTDDLVSQFEELLTDKLAVILEKAGQRKFAIQLFDRLFADNSAR
jgi:hypothetical protein